MEREKHINIIKNCNKGKHRLRTNRFGVTWCVVCGLLSNTIADELKCTDKITIKN